VIGRSWLDKAALLLVLSNMLALTSIPAAFSVEEGWLRVEDEHFIVYYQSGYKDDALKVLQYADQARQIVLAFIPYEVDGKVKIYIYPGPSTTESGWYITYGHMSADYMRKSIYLIAPSEALKQSSYYDDIWHKKNVIHEYVHVVVGNLIYEKLKRYKGNYLPRWFDEGIAEYAGIFLSNDPRIKEKYSSELKKIEDLVKNGKGFFMIVASNVYYGGAYLVYFLHDVYGQEPIMNLFTKSYPDFYTALERETGKSLRELEVDWLKWACNKFNVNFSQVYEEISQTIKTTVTLSETITKTLTEKVKLTEIHIAIKTVYTTSIITKTTSTTKTLTETKTRYQTETTKILGETFSVTSIALATTLIMGLCLLVTLTLLIRKRRK